VEYAGAVTEKYQSEPVPAWLAPADDGLDCVHVFDKEIEVPPEELPRYAHQVKDMYCSWCGVKQTAKDKIQAHIGTKGS